MNGPPEDGIAGALAQDIFERYWATRAWVLDGEAYEVVGDDEYPQICEDLVLRRSADGLMFRVEVDVDVSPFVPDGVNR